MLNHISVESTLLKAVMHEAVFRKHDGSELSVICLLDSGALHASYIRRSFVEENIEAFQDYLVDYYGKAVLADKITELEITQALCIPLSLVSLSGRVFQMRAKFLVMDSLGEQIIIGLPLLVGHLLPLFVEALQHTAELMLRPGGTSSSVHQIIENPWTVWDELAEEDEETPLPCSFSGPLHFLMMPRQAALEEYFGLFESHIDPGMRDSTPIVELLRTLGSEVFVPVKWEGIIGMEPIEFNWKQGMPDRIMPRPRPVNPKLLEHAKKEMERMLTYFYIPSTSPIASCLVIAPKATSPFIRFCGDYATLVNHYIETGHYPIPHVFHSLEKISKFKKFFDLDMSNSFHQFPLAEKTRRLLSIQTPWGQYEPVFLPEGVPPASGILQKFVSEVFADFDDWMLSIFDNILVLAHDYQDGYTKVEKVLRRCKERRIVLKFSKSWFGFDSCEFFGYKCSYKNYCLTQKRKDSIMEIPMPDSVKAMQRFLGCSLFFSKFIPNFAEKTARLHDMTRKSFVWKKETWKHDYTKFFEDFKAALLESVTLYYPNYDLPWILRVDASEDGVGFVLMQLDGDIHRAVLFGSKKFSDQAKKWDTFNKEAFALYFGVKDCDYYLRPVHFQLEGDHRNLCWMETSMVPKVIRWRVYLQGFSFDFNHIPGTTNRVADWQSRLFSVSLPDSPGLARRPVQELSGLPDSPGVPNMERLEEVNLTRESMLQKVHGWRSSHPGARRTWMLLNENFPGHGISYRQVAEFVSGCIICQKTRHAMTEVLVPIVRHLKGLPGSRSVVGIDHLSLEADKFDMTGVYVARDHFSKFVFIHPVKEQSSVGAATALFLYSVYFGCFDYLMSDPGSEMTSETLRQLNSWFGIHHRVSLTDRHESNGVEGANRDILRHIRAFLSEERLKDRWSEPNVVAWCMFIMNKLDDSESGVSPYQLMFGSDALKKFLFPKASLDRSTATEYLKKLDEDLELARRHSSNHQNKLVEQRTRSDKAQNLYQPGDFVLHKWPDDKPAPSKLIGRYQGPYVVISQSKNDVSCRHCALGRVQEFFVADLKLFMGTADEALRMASLDADQFIVDKFLAYRGDPMTRLTVEFLVRFADGTEVWLPWSDDLFTTVQYEDYIRSIPELLPLLHRIKDTKKLILDENRRPIEGIKAGDKFWFDIRYYGADWYAALSLPDLHTSTYLAEHVYGKLTSDRRKVEIVCKLLKRKFIGTPFFIHQYGQRPQPREDDRLVTPLLIAEHPSLLSTEVLTRSQDHFAHLVGRCYVDDDDKRTYEVVRVATLRDRSIVAFVKWIRKPYSRSKLIDTPIHIADVARMVAQFDAANPDHPIP